MGVLRGCVSGCEGLLMGLLKDILVGTSEGIFMIQMQSWEGGGRGVVVTLHGATRYHRVRECV